MRFILAAAITIIIFIFFGAVNWYMWSLQPAARGQTKQQTFHLKPGTSTSGLARQLESQKLIRSATTFEWYVTFHGLRGKLQAGYYDLSPGQKVSEIARVIASGRKSANRLVIPEGTALAKIKQLVVEHGVNQKDFEQALAESYDNELLRDRPPSLSLEGYLFPDTYEIVRPPNSRAIIQSMIDNFSKKVNATDIAAAFAAQGLTVHQGVTLASIVEKEAAKPEDRPIIAQVFLKRLKQGLALESDVTVIYAAPSKPFDINVDSPYNTYKNKGLPPGPICNPGLDSLKAAAHPATTDYLYFLADKKGTVHYAKTFAEHEENVKSYLK